MEEKHKKMKKISSEQYQYMMNFLSEHKLMLKGKLSPAESTKVGELCMQLTSSGKEYTFIEYKSKAKAKWRVIQNKLKGTGGGPAEAQLNDTENLCLNLIGRITTKGDPELQEIGLTNEGASTSSDCELITVVVGYSDASNAQRFEEVAYTELIDTEMATSDTCSIPIIKEVRVKNAVHTPKSKKRRVTITPTPKSSALKELADTNERICESLALINSTINEVSKSNDAIASSNNNLATLINTLANAIKLVAEQKLK